MHLYLKEVSHGSGMCCSCLTKYLIAEADMVVRTSYPSWRFKCLAEEPGEG